MLTPKRIPAIMAITIIILAAATVLALSGTLPLTPQSPPREGTVFYVVPYHYGFAFYDRNFREIERIEVEQGEVVTLYIIPALALPKEVFLEYANRTVQSGIRGLPPGDPLILEKIIEDIRTNPEHIVGISGYPLHVQTNVSAVLGGRLFREGGPRTLLEAVGSRDPTIKVVTFTADKAGTFDFICLDAGPGGGATCGWGHPWMFAKKAFIVHSTCC